MKNGKPKFKRLGVDILMNIKYNKHRESEEFTMPELSRFYGIIIKMIFSDTQQHNKPHIHAMYGEYQAAIAIDGEMLAGYMPPKQLKLILAWLTIHEEELYKAWNNAVRDIPFEKIEPLK